MTNEEAITLVKDAFCIWENEYDTGNDWSKEHEACDMAIKALETTSCIKEKCAYCPHCDNCDVDDDTLEIKALEQQPCNDCISREEALRHRHLIHDDDGIGYSVVRVDEIIELPSVTPQLKPTGSWVGKIVVDDVEIDEWQSARCSKCGKYHITPYLYYFDDYNYCPNCGAKMESAVRKHE